MSPRDLVYVGHMLDMARKAVSKTQGLSREAYDADENLRLALKDEDVSMTLSKVLQREPDFQQH